MNSVGACKWFNGFIHPMHRPDHGQERCDAGVEYRKEFGQHAQHAPCISYAVERYRNGRATYGLVADLMRKETRLPRQPYPTPCSRYCEPTDEENDNDVRETERWLELTMQGLKVASEWRVRPKPKADRYEVVGCPVCGGKLHLSQSSYNGHVHGKCETDKCLSWME